MFATSSIHFGKEKCLGQKGMRENRFTNQYYVRHFNECEEKKRYEYSGGARGGRGGGRQSPRALDPPPSCEGGDSQTSEIFIPL